MSPLRKLASKVKRTANQWLDDGYRPDEFTQRLLVSVAGMTERGNIAAFEHAIARMPAGAVVEIGIFCGQSTILLDHLLRRHHRDNPLLCTDIWIYHGMRDQQPFDSERERQRYMATVAGREDLDRRGYEAHIRQRFLDNCQYYCRGRLPGAFDLSSDAFFAAWEAGEQREDLFGADRQLGGPIALAYIDGDHSYAQASADFRNAARHVVPGGFVLLDDSYDGCDMGSAQLAQEVLGEGAWELVSARPNNLFRRR